MAPRAAAAEERAGRALPRIIAFALRRAARLCGQAECAGGETQRILTQELAHFLEISRLAELGGLD